MRSRAVFALFGLSVAVMTAVGGRFPPAGAEVARGGGFFASVDGHRGWFGSYEMAGIGTVWCVDHGIPAPDADYGYVPTELSDRPAPVRAAIAWALGRHGHGPDRVTSAALTLALHDLMAASYPSGPLDVGRLTLAGLSGFDGAEKEVLSRARVIKADALAHARLRGPFRLSADVQQVGPGQSGTLTVRLSDAVGSAVSGVALHTTAAGAGLAPGTSPAVTDGAGEQRFRFVASAGENRFQVSGTVPDVRLRSFASATRRAQRVARPGRVPVSAGAGFTAQVRRLSIRKVGDASAYLPLAGARFQARRVGPGGTLSNPVGEVVTDGAGRSPSLELAPGSYHVSEVAAPAGYVPGGPWTVDLTGADAVLEAANVARPGMATITKVDSSTGRGLPGATLALAYDADHDGSFETAVGRLVTTASGVARRLRPGDYELRELSPPAGYQLAGRAVRFSVSPAQAITVTVANTAAKAPPAPPAPRPPAARLPPEARPAPPRPSSGALPATGAHLSLLALIGSGLVLTGGVLTAASGRGLTRSIRWRMRRC